MYWEKIIYFWFVLNIVLLFYGFLVVRVFFIFFDKINSVVVIFGCIYKNDFVYFEINIRIICYL